MYLWNRTPTDTDCCSEPEGTSVAALNKTYRGIYYTQQNVSVYSTYRNKCLLWQLKYKVVSAFSWCVYRLPLPVVVKARCWRYTVRLWQAIAAAAFCFQFIFSWFIRITNKMFCMHLVLQVPCRAGAVLARISASANPFHTGLLNIDSPECFSIPNQRWNALNGFTF